MALKGTLSIDGNTERYTLVECEYRLTQAVSVDGIPEDGVHAGTIVATIVTPTKGYVLYEWMLNDFMKKDGNLCFVTNVNNINKSGTRNIRFEDAFCIDLYEYFNNHNSVMMTTRLVIQARKIMFGDSSNTGIGLDNATKKVVEGPVPEPGKAMNRLSML